jgi:hypothetical protein
MPSDCLRFFSFAGTKVGEVCVRKKLPTHTSPTKGVGMFRFIQIPLQKNLGNALE